MEHCIYDTRKRTQLKEDENFELAQGIVTETAANHWNALPKLGGTATEFGRLEFKIFQKQVQTLSRRLSSRNWPFVVFQSFSRSIFSLMT